MTQRLFGIVFGACVKRSEPALDTYHELAEYILSLRACSKSFDKNGRAGDNRKKQAGAGENTRIPK